MPKSALVYVGLLGVGLQGCALMDLTVTPPPPQTLAQPPTTGRGRGVAIAMPLADVRPDRERCGMQKNGYNMETASVHCALPPAQWMAQALAQGLTAAGFRVRASAQTKSDAPVTIDGTLLQFFAEPRVGFFTVTPEADISIKLVVTSRTGLVAERTFYVKGSKIAFAGTQRTFERAVASGTEQAVAAMVAAIGSLLDRYPQLGDPSAPAAAAISLVTPVSPAGADL